METDETRVDTGVDSSGDYDVGLDESAGPGQEDVEGLGSPD